MTRTLSKRMAKAESRAHLRWLASPEATCPWAWTARFLTAEPTLIEVLEHARSVSSELDFRYIPKPMVRIHVGQAADVLMEHCGGFLVKDHVNWKPEGAKKTSWLCYVQLVALCQRYMDRTGDRPPGGSVFMAGNVWQ